METNYRTITENEIDTDLFSHFIRTQVVTDCWRRVGGQWVIQSDPFLDDWSEKDILFLVQCLRNTVHTGGFLYGAYVGNQLKGFVSVERELFGTEGQYADLTSLHVSQDMRRLGIGRTLFRAAKEYGKRIGAQKLYLSAHSAVESQAFYRAMGCVEAKEYQAHHVASEPFDCQLECQII